MNAAFVAAKIVDGKNVSEKQFVFIQGIAQQCIDALGSDAERPEVQEALIDGARYLHNAVLKAVKS